MKIFIYPKSVRSVNVLKEHCRFLSIPDPICWDYKKVRFRVENLIKSEETVLPFEVYPGPKNSVLSEFSKHSPMILFSGISTPMIKELICLYKQGYWPIFAVITRPSLRMTLSCLLKHLIKDRKLEEMGKQRIIDVRTKHKDL